MKKIKLVATALFMVAAFWSCKKDTSEMPIAEEPPVTPVPTAVGLWEGKYGTASSPNTTYALLLKTNGTMRAYIGGSDTSNAFTKADGTWSINGLVIKTTYVVSASNTHSTEGLANNDFTTKEGSWKGTTAISQGGFKLTKKK